MLDDRIIPTISYTELVRESFSIEKKKTPNTIGIFRYNSKSKKGSRFLFFFSSSVYEAKYCDLKSVIIDKRGLDYFPDLLENGDAELALESQKLKEIIQKIL